jgi:hypothetical protein
MVTLMRWKTFSVAIVAGTLLAVAGAVGAGYHLPGQIRKYTPLKNIYLRLQNVADNAIKATPPCIIFAGDSRTAMNVNTRQISFGPCESQNYAFPALPLDAMRHLLTANVQESQPAEILVIVASELVFNAGHIEVFSPLDLRQLIGTPYFWDALLSFHPARRGYIGAARFGRLLEYVTDPGKKPPPAVVWSDELGRWQYEVSETRVMIDLAGRSEELIVHARDYYEKRNFGNPQQELVSFISSVKHLARRFAIVLPPLAPGAKDAAERVSPGQLAGFVEAVRTAAQLLGTPLIDCSNAESCGVPAEGWADSVHLNAGGAVLFSAALANRLAPFVTADAGKARATPGGRGWTH